jgi:hypothetical protein
MNQPPAAAAARTNTSRTITPLVCVALLPFNARPDPTARVE